MDNNDFLNNVMRDLKVELDDEFDRNFERKAFFDRPWAPLSPNYNPSEGSMLMRTGALRRSLHSRIDGTRLIYESSLKYAGLQNYGGTVRQDFVPSDKMRRWAWAKAVNAVNRVTNPAKRSSAVWPSPNGSGGRFQYQPAPLSASIPV